LNSHSTFHIIRTLYDRLQPEIISIEERTFWRRWWSKRWGFKCL